jgi:hypothetical protein
VIGPWSTGDEWDIYEAAVLLQPLPIRWLIRWGFLCLEAAL